MHISPPSLLAYAAGIRRPVVVKTNTVFEAFACRRVMIPRQRFISNTPASVDSTLDPSPPRVNERKFIHPEHACKLDPQRRDDVHRLLDMQIRMVMRVGGARSVIIARRQTSHRTPVRQYLTMTSATMVKCSKIER